MLPEKAAITKTDIRKRNVKGAFIQEESLLDFEGKELRIPKWEEYMPDVQFTKWHVREVFHTP